MLSFLWKQQDKTRIPADSYIYSLWLLKQMQFALFTCYKMILIVYKSYQIIINFILLQTESTKTPVYCMSQMVYTSDILTRYKYLLNFYN